MMQAAMGYRKEDLAKLLATRTAAQKHAATPHFVRDPLEEAELDRAGEGTESSYYDTEEESEEEQEEDKDKAESQAAASETTAATEVAA